MEILFVVLIFAVLAFSFWCMKKEKTLAGFYKQIGVCGRVHAFCAIYGILIAELSVVFFVVCIVRAIAGSPDILPVALGVLLGGVIGATVGIPLFLRAYKRCPEDLQKRLPWDMFVICWGVLFRVSLFFLMFLVKAYWTLNKPTAYEVNGQTVYAYPGDDRLYDSSGCRVGTLTSDHTEAIMD